MIWKENLSENFVQAGLVKNKKWKHTGPEI